MKNENLTINFIYFTANFQYDFIEKCWSDNEILQKHLRSKFKSRVENGFVSSGGFVKWFFDLDKGNQFKLISWVNENYEG